MLSLERVDKNMSKSEPLGQPHWLIAKLEHGKMEVLTVDLGGEGEALAVFSSQEEAEVFLRLRLGTSRTGWKARETSAGELTSLLYGPCLEVGKVALDPLQEVGGEALSGVLSMEREDFLRILLGEEPSSLTTVSSRTLARKREGEL